MNERQIRVPGPDHPITITAHPGRVFVSVGGRVSLETLESEHIRRILASAHTLDDAAKTLGIDPATLYRKRQKLGLL